jgi:hypothetical protein
MFLHFNPSLGEYKLFQATFQYKFKNILLLYLHTAFTLWYD